MSFEALANRRVDLEHTTTTTVDAHGNATTITTGWTRDVAARRELLTAEERATLGEFTSSTFCYWLPAEVTLTDRDRIHDAGVTFEVRGAPSAETGFDAVHHLEAIAEKVAG